jgi:hypothetical protein
MFKKNYEFRGSRKERVLVPLLFAGIMATIVAPSLVPPAPAAAVFQECRPLSSLNIQGEILSGAVARRVGRRSLAPNADTQYEQTHYVVPLRLLLYYAGIRQVRVPAAVVVQHQRGGSGRTNLSDGVGHNPNQQLGSCRIRFQAKIPGRCRREWRERHQPKEKDRHASYRPT